MPQRARGDRGRRPRHDVRPVRRLLHGEARDRPGGRRRRRHRRAGRREHPPGRQGQGRATPRTSRSCILDRPRHEELVRGDPRGRRPDQVHHRRRRRRRDHGGPRGHRRRPAARHRRHPRGHHRRLRDQVPGRRDPGQAVAHATTRSGQRRSTPGTTSTGCSPPTTWSAATTCSSSPPASPTASCCAACATGPAARTTQSLVMRSQVAARSGRSTASTGSTKLRAYTAIDFDHAV